MGLNGKVHYSTSTPCTQNHLAGQPGYVIASDKVLRGRLAESLIAVSSITGRLHLPRCFIGSIIVFIWLLSSLSEAGVRYIDQHDYLYLHLLWLHYHLFWLTSTGETALISLISS